MTTLDERLFSCLFRWGQNTPIVGASAAAAARQASRVFSGCYTAGLVYLVFIQDPYLVVYVLGPACSIATALLLHRLFYRPRPGVAIPSVRFEKPDVRVEGASFPSKHSVSAFSIGGAFLLRWPVLGAGLLALAVATAVSRVVDGAHYPSDTAAGALLGLGWVVLLSLLLGSFIP